MTDRPTRVELTELENKVWEMRFRGIGDVVAATGKSERVVAAAFERARAKMRDLETRARAMTVTSSGSEGVAL